MKNAQAKVAEFMAAKNLKFPANPTIPELGSCLSRYKWIEEELNELKDAFIADDVVAVADAIGDLLYFVLGAAVDCGIDIEPVFDEIHRSNMTKFIGGLQLRPDGKMVKGPHYEPPNLGPIIHSQVKQAPAPASWVGFDSDGA